MELPWAWTVLPPNIEWAITWAAEDIWYTSLTWYHLKNSVQNRSIRPFIISLSGSTSLISWCSSHKIILFLHWCLPPELTVKRMLNQFSWESFLLPNLSSQTPMSEVSFSKTHKACEDESVEEFLSTSLIFQLFQGNVCIQQKRITLYHPQRWIYWKAPSSPSPSSSCARQWIRSVHAKVVCYLDKLTNAYNAIILPNLWQVFLSFVYVESLWSIISSREVIQMWCCAPGMFLRRKLDR